MDVCLPRDDPRPEQRRARIARQRDVYGYDHDYLPPLAISQGCPRAEYFTAPYLARRLVASRRLLANLFLAWARTRLASLRLPEDFARMFVTLPRPRSTRAWRDDVFFARQRLDGANPMRIRRLLHPDELPFAVGPGGVGERLPGTGTTVEDAVEAGALYLADYAHLAPIGGGEWRGLRRYLPAPRALFHWRTARHAAQGTLFPVAIELHPGCEVSTPERSRSWDWLAAKLCVQIADANDMELGSHLARTHLVIEPFAIATPRHLAADHPLHRLLEPHLRFLIVNTRLGRQILMKPGSLSDQLCGGTREGSLEIVRDSYRGWSLDGNALDADLAERCLDDPGLLPDFPYREDGRRLWQALREYVDGYLALYYREPADVAGDAELQAWAAELASPDGGRVKGMPARIDGADTLARVLTMVLFTSGPQHALVNYGQSPFLGFAPNMPLAAYCDVPTCGAFESDEDLMRVLPPPEWARRQLLTMEGLSAYQHDRLGHYPPGHFRDPEVQPVIRGLQGRLGEIETAIDERNLEREEAYEFLKPSRVPNSISI